MKRLIVLFLVFMVWLVVPGMALADDAPPQPPPGFGIDPSVSPSPDASETPSETPSATPEATPTKSANPPTESPAPTSNYKLRAGDQVVLTFLGLQEEAPVHLQIRADGGVYCPRVGEIHPAGWTLGRLKKEVEAVLSKHLVNYHVDVGLLKEAPHFAMILGEVNKPGQIEVSDHTTIYQAVSQVGGTAPLADSSQVTILRDGKKQIVSLAPTDTPPMVLPGDVVYVNKAGKISLGGSVVTPGAVPITVATSTLWDTLMKGGGPKPEAALGRVTVTRLSLPVKDQQKILDVSRGPQSPDSNFKLEDGDLVNVPDQKILIVSLGSAAKTGAFPISGPQPLLDVIVSAGVADEKTLSKVAVVRARDVVMPKDLTKAPSVPPNKVERYDIAKALQKGQLETLPTVADGDIIIVPPAAKESPITIQSVFSALTLVRLFFPSLP